MQRSVANQGVEIVVDNSMVYSPAYDPVIRRAIISEVIVGLVAALMLDGGTTARVVGTAVLVYWVCVALIVERLPHEPSRFELGSIQWGFWVVLGVAMLWHALA